jgi:hypothetical protein
MSLGFLFLQYYYYLIFLRFGGTLPLFLFIFTLIEQIYFIFMYTRGAEPTFEPGPAVQQAGALLSEPHRTLMSHTHPVLLVYATTYSNFILTRANNIFKLEKVLGKQFQVCINWSALKLYSIYLKQIC